MSALEKISSVIAEELNNFKKVYVKSLHSENPLLQEIVAHVTKSSGKMMRPILVLLSAKISGGITEKTIKSAVALELLHVASLIHLSVVAFRLLWQNLKTKLLYWVVISSFPQHFVKQ